MQDGALQALGLLFAARPALMQSPEVVALMRAVLQPSSSAAFKTRLLMSLADLLRARCCHSSLMSFVGVTQTLGLSLSVAVSLSNMRIRIKSYAPTKV